MTLLLPLVISALAVSITFLYAAWQDLKTRTVLTVTWYPAAVIGGAAVLIFWYQALQQPTAMTILILILSLLIAAMMGIIGKLGIFGMADAKALILLSLTVPVTPFAAWTFPSLAVSAIVNASVLAALIPAALLLSNTLKNNHAPFWLKCSGLPVPGSEITRHFGFIAEKLTDGDPLTREFLPARSSVRTLSKNPELIIRNLRDHPDTYAEQIELCRKAETVWITYGIPFLIPLTAGYLLALCGLSITDIVLNLL